MQTKKVRNKISRLSWEMLGCFGAAAVIAVYCFAFFSSTANSLAASYCNQNAIMLTEMQQWALDSWITSISISCSAVIFVVLFLLLCGRKLEYLREIIKGIEALRTHRMDYKLRLQGNNELTELAASINFLSEAERELQQKETLMREEREGLIRSLSHDIRTPLTAILSYTEYMKEKDKCSDEELAAYFELMEQKGAQIKSLTDRLLDGGRVLERFENGRFLMAQLAEEWQAALEEEFCCSLNMEGCPEFAAELDVEEIRRIFDNLASNVKKYAEKSEPAILEISRIEERLAIIQSNTGRRDPQKTESNKIGLESIKKIAQQYGGSLVVTNENEKFRITILLMKLA